MREFLQRRLVAPLLVLLRQGVTPRELARCLAPVATNYPGSKITAVSNSRTQKLHIERQAHDRNLANLEVITCDVNRLAFPEGRQFDRVVSVEMFEHMRNYGTLLYFQRDVRILEHWQVPGWHDPLTGEAWLSNMDRHRAELMPVLVGCTGACFSWPARSCGDTLTATNGWYRITFLRGAEKRYSPMP